jgi:rhodanese-related sulfurtransferase
MKSMEIYESSEITVQRLNELRDLDKKIQILDVREDTERDHAHVKGTIHIKLTEIAKRHIELEKNKNIFVMCHTGTRSQTVVKWLKSQGYMHSVNVLGGIDAWAALIDREIRRY